MNKDDEIPHSITETIIVFKNVKEYLDEINEFKVRLSNSNTDKMILIIKVRTFIRRLRAKAYRNNDIQSILDPKDMDILTFSFAKEFEIDKVIAVFDDWRTLNK